MNTVNERAYAKINLLLDVVNKRADGYHNLEMIMQTIDLYDDVRVEKVQAGIHLVCATEFVPNNEKNIAWKAADLFCKKYNIKSGVKIDIKKRIPVAAGLAGGSSDAAAVLRAMMKLFDIYPSKEELVEMALSLGADVPYCLEGGTCIAEGLGERLIKLDDFAGVHILLVKPNVGVSTVWCFKNYRQEKVSKRPNLNKMVEDIKGRDINMVAHGLCNVLESVTIPEHPVIDNIKKQMLDNGAIGAIMSGSGPSVFGIFSSGQDAENAKKSFDGQDMFVYKTKTR